MQRALYFLTMLLLCTFNSKYTVTHAAEPVALPVTDPPANQKIEYAIVAKLLKQNCVACHNSTKAENSLNLESPDLMLKGGDSGPAIVAKNSSQSLLWKLAAHRDNPIMPPVDNKVNAKQLTATELGLLKAWIDQGAIGQAATTLTPLTWQPLPNHVSPVMATALTGDGGLAAAGWGNEILLLEPASGRVLSRLVDPALTKQAGPRGTIAHLDLVQSLAFDPSGELLASGSYREIKLWRRPTNSKHGELPKANAAVNTMAVSADGKLAAWGTTAGQIVIVELSNNQVLQTIAAHQGSVTGLCFATDATILFSSGVDQQLSAWKVSDGSNQGKLTAPAAINSLALVSEGKQLVTGDADHKLRVWALPTLPAPETAPTPVFELPAVSAPIIALAGHPGSKYIAAADASNAVKVWSLESKQVKLEFNHGAKVTAVGISSDGKRVASCGENGVAKITNVADSKLLAEVRGDSRQQRTVSKLERALSLAKSRLDERKQDVTEAETLAKKEQDAVPKTKELKTTAEKSLTEKQTALKQPTLDKEAAEKSVVELTDKLKSQSEVVAAAELAAKAEDKKPELQQQLKQALAALKTQEAALESAKKRVVDTTKALQKPFEDVRLANLGVETAQRGIEAAELAVQKANTAVETCKQLVTSSEAAIKAAESALADGKTAATKSEQPWQTVSFSTDGGILYTAGNDGLVQAWSTDTGNSLTVVSRNNPAIKFMRPTANGLLLAFENQVLVHCNPNAAWTLERTIGQVDDASSLSDRVLALEFSPNGQLLVSGGGEPSRSGEVKLWNPADGKLVRALTDPHSDTVFAVRFSNSGEFLATGGADRFLKVFRVADGGLEKSFEGHTHHVLAVAWRLDGRILASGSADNTMKIWDLKTGEQRRTIQGFSKEITSLNFIADTPRVIATCGENSLRLTNTDNGGNERSFTGSGDFVYSAAVSADGKLLIAGGQDGSIRIWEPNKSDPLRVISAQK